MKQTLQFEFVGDINSDFPYICVYKSEFSNASFMDILVNSDKKLEFSMDNTNVRDIYLTLEEWEEILKEGKKFISEVLNGEYSD